jgi:hypothetical protein
MQMTVLPTCRAASDAGQTGRDVVVHGEGIAGRDQFPLLCLLSDVWGCERGAGVRSFPLRGMSTRPSMLIAKCTKQI